jgi:hypothetical protein
MHQKVIDKYLQAGYTQDEDGKLVGVLESAKDANDRKFWEQVKSSKQPVTREIIKIVRLKKAGKEHFYYHERVSSKNYLGNKIHYVRDDVGYYKDPVFERVADSRTGRVSVAGIESEDVVYEYQWPKDWTPEMEDIVSETVDLLIKTPGRSYGGFSFEEFKDKGFDELVTIGKYGTTNPIIINEIKKKQK